MAARTTYPLDFNDLAASPASPSSGYLRLFGKERRLWQRNSDGVETVLGVPVGTELNGFWIAAPAGYLLEDGTQQANLTYEALLDVFLGVTYKTRGSAAVPDAASFIANTTQTAAQSTVTAASRSGSDATFTTSAAHGFAAGDLVLIRGMTPAGWNGLYPVDSTPTTTTFHVTLDTAPAAATVFGTAAVKFVLPDARGRFAFGKATAGTGSTLGGTFGSIDHTHTQPTHTHTSAGHTHPVGTLVNAAEAAHTHGVGSYANTAENAHTHGAGTLVNAAENAHTHDLDHRHTLTTVSNAAGGGTGMHVTSATTSQAAAFVTGNLMVSTGAGTSHNHTISGSSGAGASHNHTFSGTSGAGASHNHTISGSSGSTTPADTGASGNDATGSNNPPAIVVNKIVKF